MKGKAGWFIARRGLVFCLDTFFETEFGFSPWNSIPIEYNDTIETFELPEDYTK